MLTKRRSTMVLTLVTALVLTLTTKAKAETIIDDYLASKNIKVNISESIDFYNKYVWRGFLLDGDPVLQPSVTISAGGFEGGFWGSWDVGKNDSLKSDETDGWVGYNFDLGFINDEMKKVGVNFGHTWYGFPQGNTGLSQGAHSKEFYLGLTMDTFLSPYVTWYADYGKESSGGGNGNYVMAGISHSFTLNEKYGITLDTGYEFGYNSKAFIAHHGGYNLLTLGLTLPMTDKFTITPNIGYSMPYGDIADSNNDEFYAGVSTGFSI